MSVFDFLQGKILCPSKWWWPWQQKNIKVYGCAYMTKGQIHTWNSLWRSGQTRFVRMLLVELLLVLDLWSCLLFFTSVTLSDSDVTAPSIMMLHQMSRSWVRVFQSSKSVLKLFNDVLSMSLKGFLWPRGFVSLMCVLHSDHMTSPS